MYQMVCAIGRPDAAREHLVRCRLARALSRQLVVIDEVDEAVVDALVVGDMVNGAWMRTAWPASRSAAVRRAEVVIGALAPI